jgi:hypothetical protein
LRWGQTLPNSEKKSSAFASRFASFNQAARNWIAAQLLGLAYMLTGAAYRVAPWLAKWRVR